MKRIVLATLALPLFSAISMAQVAAPAPAAPPASIPAVAPTSTPGSAANKPSPVAAPMPGVTSNNPVAEPGVGNASGQNSFTESQARTRLEQNGYSNVSILTRDPNGIWRGTALHNGITVAIGLDYKGNISTN
jgi:protein CpxP